MTVRPILTWPDHRLTLKSSVVENFDEELKCLVKDMTDTITVHHALGLAAPQINVLKQVVVIDCSAFECEFERELVLINPTIELNGGSNKSKESCLSVPRFSGDVERASEVLVTYQNVEGESRSLKATGALSAAIQHECDHLEGTLYLHRMKRVARAALTKRVRKHQKEENKKLAEYKEQLKIELAEIWSSTDKVKPSYQMSTKAIARKKAARKSRRKNRRIR